ncbi:MAG: hypothetical protein JXQ71_17465 [Verrucomicrobia bacterium]|nr:hypothetical protein [Verrucomicrobiota bacterium]
MTPTLAIALDSLLTLLLFVVLAGLSSWLKKKGQAHDDGSPPQRPPPPPAGTRRTIPRTSQRTPTAPPLPPSRSPLNWEEQLRRLLQGAPSPAAPPVVTPSKAVPQPHPQPPPPSPTPALKPAPSMPDRLQRSPMPRLVTRVAQLEQAQELARQQQRERERTALLRRAAAAPSRSPRPAPAPSHLPERLLVRSMLLTPSSVRSAFVLSAILGPPRALDEQPGSPGLQ